MSNLVTNKPKANASAIVNALFPGKFAYVFGNTAYQPKKPHPCLTQLAMSLLDVKKDETVFIGDSHVDVNTAKNAKVKCIGCLWGFRDEEDLQGADFLAAQPMDILKIIHNM